MLTAERLYRLVSNLADLIASSGTESAGTEDTPRRESLLRFADEYDLDLEDAATWLRVASGESYEGLGT